MEKLDIALQAAKSAGGVVQRMRQTAIAEIGYKTPKDLVTPADLASEEIIISIISKHFPNDAILAEESSPAYSDPKKLRGPIWIIDPIDGTTNFAHQQPHCAVSIAYAEDGEVQLGVVHAPFYNETFHAVRSGGAFLNGNKIQVRQIDQLKDGLVATGFVYREATHEQTMERLARVVRATLDVRRIGAAALDIAWIGCGRIDGFYEVPLSPWDIAAAKLIATEAGARSGFIVGPSKDEVVPTELFSHDVIVACPQIFEQLHAILKICA